MASCFQLNKNSRASKSSKLPYCFLIIFRQFQIKSGSLRTLIYKKNIKAVNEVKEYLSVKLIKYFCASNSFL